MRLHLKYATIVSTALITMGLLSLQCSLFETREPEHPSQSSFHFDPPTQPEIVISNLRYAVEEKNVANYMNCFVDPLSTTRTFRFAPSTDGASLGPWTLADERAYFQNLTTSTGDNGFSQLTLTLRNNPFPIDTVRYEYGYSLTFMHSKPGVPTTVLGHMELSLGRESNGSWAIYAWADYKDSSATWSRLKVEFQ
jgi:hypothetical protein